MKYLKQKDLSNFRTLATPKQCPILLFYETDWVLDHDHESGQVRWVISSEANVFLGRIERAYKRLSKLAKTNDLSDILRNVADYLDRGCRPIIHPEGYRQLYKRFTRKSKTEQNKILTESGAATISVSSCKNNKDRLNLYKQILKL
tara:strand:- start:7807 stop:8244 length:438 start_codon:yes stop_codon:yes gene_type:complete